MKKLYICQRNTWSTKYMITMRSTLHTAQGSKSERAVIAVETIGPAVLNGGATSFQMITHQDHQEQHHPHLQENWISSYIILKIRFLSPGVTTFLALVLLAGSTSHTFLTFFKVTLIMVHLMKILFGIFKRMMMAYNITTPWRVFVPGVIGENLFNGN